MPEPSLVIETKAQLDNIVNMLSAGEFDERPDEKASLVEAAQTATDRFARDQFVRQNVVTTPITELQEANPAIPVVPFGFGVSSRSIKFVPKETSRVVRLRNMARDSGIDADTPLPPNVALAMSIAERSPLVQKLILEDFARKQAEASGFEFPVDSQGNSTIQLVRVDPNSGLPTYLRPTTQEDVDRGVVSQEQLGALRETIANPPGANLEDLLTIGSNIQTAVLEGVPAIGAAIVTTGKAPPTATAAAVVGAAGAGTLLDLQLRRGALKLLGVDPQIANRMDDAGLKQFFIAGSTELAGGLTFGIYRHFANKSRFVETLADATRLAKEAEGAMETLAKVVRSEGQLFKPSAGGVTDDATLKVLGAKAESTATGATARRIQVAELENRAASQESIKSILEDAAPRRNSISADEELGESVASTVVRRDVDLEAAQRGVEKAHRDLALARERLGDAASRDFGVWQGFQVKGKSAAEAAKQAEDTLWDSFDDLYGRALIKNTGSTPITRAFRKLVNEGDASLSKEYQNGILNLLDSLGWDSQAIRLQRSGKRSTMTAEQIAQETGQTLQGLAQREFTFKQARTLLSHLKQMKRNISVGQVQWDSNALTQVIQAVTEQVEKGAATTVDRAGRTIALSATRRRALMEHMDEATRATLIRVTSFENKVWKDIFALEFNPKLLARTDRRPTDKANLRFALPHEELFEKVFVARADGGERVFRSAMEIVGESPQIKKMLIKELDVEFKKRVIDSKGRFREGAYAQFIDDFGPQMKMLTRKKGSEGVNVSPRARSAFEFDRAVAAAEKHFDNTIDIMEKTLGRPFAQAAKNGDNYIGTLSADIYGGKYSPAQTTELLKRLDSQAPAVADDLRSNFSKFLHNKFLNENTALGVNLDTIDNVLASKSATIKAMFGDAHFDRLQTVSDAIHLVTRGTQGRTFRTPVQPATLQLTRAMIGALSRKQRMLTGVNRLVIVRRGNRDVKKFVFTTEDPMNEILSNPDLLEKFVKIGTLNPKTLAWSAAMVDLFDVGPSDLIASNMDEGTGDNLYSREFRRQMNLRAAQQRARRQLNIPGPGGVNTRVEDTGPLPFPQGTRTQEAAGGAR